MSKNIGGCAIARKMQSGWPEQGVEIQNIFTNEVILFSGRVWFGPFLKVQAFLLAKI